jgi:hypothetical protein
MTQKNVTLEIRERVAILTLNRPDVLNSLNGTDTNLLDRCSPHDYRRPVTVCHPLDHLYSIAYAFQLPRVHRPADPTDDASLVSLQPLGKLDQGRYLAFMNLAQPLRPFRSPALGSIRRSERGAAKETVYLGSKSNILTKPLTHTSPCPALRAHDSAEKLFSRFVDSFPPSFSTL